MSIRIEDLVFDGGGNKVSIDDLVFDEGRQQALQEQAQISQLRQVPEMINRGQGLPIGGEPMVGGPDILAQEQGQTKTFMEDEEGKPVEVRRAQAIDIGGKIIQEPISPDGMTLDFRGNLIKEKTKELESASGLPFSEYRSKSNALRSELSKLQQEQQKHEANQLDFLSRLISGKKGVSVDVETGLGEARVTGAEGKITTVPIQTRTMGAVKAIGDQREFIDNIIGNDKFLDYIKTKGIDAPGMMSRMSGQYLNVGEAPDKIAQLKQNPEVRKLAEEWAMTTPDFMDTATDIFKRAWDGYAGAIGSGTIGPVGLLLKEAGFEESGQALVNAAEYADQQRLLGQDPRKVGALAQFGRDVSGGLGFTAAAITTGALGNAARVSLGLNSAKAISLFQKGNTLSFVGLNSAWAGYSEAKSDGATEDQAKQAALFSALTQAPLELVSPLQKWIGRFDPIQQQAIYRGLNRAAQAVIEGGQEALFNEMPQQIAGNLVKKYVYDPNQDIFEGTAYAGGVGGAAGILTSIFTQMISGKKAKNKALQGDQEGSEETDIESKADAMADQLAPDAVSDLAQQMTAVSGEMDNLKQEIADDEMGLQAIEKTAPAYQAAELVLNEKKANLAQLQTQFDKLSAGPAEVKEAPAAGEVKPSATKEEATTKIEELNKEFDALDEKDKVGIDRVNKQIFAEQNKIAELTAIEQGIDPQGTTPTREMELPPSGRRTTPTRPRMLAGEFYADRPILKAFMSATDKAVGAIPVFSKRAQKIKNAIRTGITSNAGFLAGTNTEVISSEEYGKLTGGKQVAADKGTYRATFLNGKKYLVVPDINQLAGISIQGEQRAASKDAALDQESRAASKKLEEEMIHLAMFQGIQDEYKALKKPKLTEQEYIVKRLVDIAKEVKRTNPNALPGVSNAYLNDKSRLLNDLSFSQEFMRMVIQRVRTGQITEDLNAIRQAEKEAFSDQDKGAIISLKNSILNALRVVRDSITRYLGKGTSTKEVEKIKNAINTILDEYGIVKGEANYEFKDYSSAQPKGELKAEPIEVTPTVEESLPVEAVSETITPAIEAKASVTPIENIFDARNGIGQVPDNTRVDYRGFVKYMTPNEFRSLVPFGVSGEETKSFVVNALKEGKKLGQPFISAVWNEAAGVWEIDGHEGRSRTDAIKEVYGNVPIPVHIFPRNGIRGSDITDQMRTAPFISEDKVSAFKKNPKSIQPILIKTPAIEAGAPFFQDFEVFSRKTDNRTVERIVVEADTVEQAERLIRETAKYRSIIARNRDEKIRFMSVGKPSLLRMEGESGILAESGVTPQMDVEYAEAINGDTGNDTITPKTNQETWANNNPESADKINSLIFQRLDEVGHLWKGMWKPPMFKAASRDFKSAGGDVGSFFAETKETAMDYLERGGKIFTAYIKMDNPANSPDIIRVLSKAFPQYAEQFVEDEGDWGSVMSTGGIDDGVKFVKAMQDAGYDGVYQWDGADSVAVVFNPNQAKSADLATFTSRGKVIPISERFSPESPLIARAGVTPEGEPMSKKSESAMKRISNQMIDELEGLVETLKPKRSKALTEYKSKTIQKGKTYPKSLISPYSVAANVFTSDAFTDGVNALNKITRGNPDADFFRIAQGISDTDYGRVKNGYSIDLEEQYVLAKVMYDLMPVFIDQVNESSMPNSARESFRLQARKVQADLARKVVMMNASGGRITRYAGRLRNIGSAGTSIASYKSSIIDAMGNIYALTKVPFENIANVIRGDRRKSVDKVANIQSVFRKAVSLIKQSQLNPEKVRQSIRAEVGKKKNASTREILLDFSAGLFDTKEDKYANMIVDQTVLNILAIGMNRKGFSIDNVSNFMYQSFAVAAKQMGVQMAGVPKQQKGKRSGKYLEMVKAVIGNDNAYKAFLADLSNRMAEKYQSKQAFNEDFGDLFKSLRSNEWADSLRTQAIKDATDAINYKFADLFQYLGEKRNATQAGVREHIRAELRGTGASNELIDKFIADADSYLNQETNRILTEKLGFTVNEETGKVTPKPLMSKKIKEEAEAQSKDIKNLKDITKLSLTDEGNFKEGLISRIITEIGMSKENATELADLISSEMDKALVAQRSENLTTALKKAEEVLTNSNIKRKTNQRTLLQRLIEMANMGMLDSEMVYEAFRQTHDFQKNYLPYDAEFVNTIRQWGDRISLLPEGVIRSIEEEKMGRALLEKSKFTGKDILSSYWYWSLLGQFATTGLNIFSGSANLISNMFIWAKYSPKTAIPMMQGFYGAMMGKNTPAVNSFLYVMRFGLNPSGMDDERRGKYPKMNVIENAKPENAGKIVSNLVTFGDGRINFLPSYVNAGLKAFSPRSLMRLLRATDAFLKEVAFEAKLAQSGASPYSKEGYEIARRQAELELVSSKTTGKQKEQEIVIRANEIYRDQRAEKAKVDIKNVEQDALETIYGQVPQGLLGRLANFVNGLLAEYASTKFFVPFTNVVANVTNEFINYTPGLSQLKLIQAKSKGVNDPFTGGRAEKEYELYIKGVIGVLTFAAAALSQVFQSGDEEDLEKRPAIQFYAEGPRDPRQNRIWAQNGGIKYSVRIGDKYISLLGTPLVIPLSLSALFTEEFQSFKKKLETKSEIDASEVAARVLISAPVLVFTSVLNQSFLTGLADLFALTQSKDPVKEGEGFISGIIGRLLVPGQLRDITKLTSDERAVGSSWASNLLKEMPGSINFLNKDVNYFGDPARYPSLVEENGVGRRLASIIGRLASSETPDPGFKIMYDLNLSPPSWNNSLNWSDGKRMTKSQELEFIRTAGPRMRDWIVENEDSLKNPEPTETQEEKGLTLQEVSQELLDNEIGKIRGEAKKDLEETMELDFSSM